MSSLVVPLEERRAWQVGSSALARPPFGRAAVSFTAIKRRLGSGALGVARAARRANGRGAGEHVTGGGQWEARTAASAGGREGE